jgi:hypothetical protein
MRPRTRWVVSQWLSYDETLELLRQSPPAAIPYATVRESRRGLPTPYVRLFLLRVDSSRYKIERSDLRRRGAETTPEAFVGHLQRLGLKVRWTRGLDGKRNYHVSRDAVGRAQTGIKSRHGGRTR